MSPYRIPPARQVTAKRNDYAVQDDHLLGALLLIIGGLRVVLAIAEREVFAAESSIALFMVALAVGLLLRRK